MEWNWNLHMTYKRWQHKSFVFGRSCNYRLSKATLGLRRSEDPTPEASDSPTNTMASEAFRDSQRLSLTAQTRRRLSLLRFRSLNLLIGETVKER